MYRDKNGTKSQNLARCHDNKYLKNADELSGCDMEGWGDRTPSSTRLFIPPLHGRDFCYVPIPITDKNYYLCGYEIMTLKYGKA